MKDLITEARELYKKAKAYLDATDGSRLDHLLRDGYDARYAELACFSVAHLPELCDALEKAQAEIERLREAQRWIPMGERTPGERFEDKGLYRVKADYSERSSTPCEKIAYWNGVVWIEPTWFDWPQNNRLNPQPTHWMPLPAPPEEGE